MQRIVINTKHGGFHLSDRAKEELVKLGLPLSSVNCEWEIERDDPRLVKVVESLGQEAADQFFCELKIVDVPDGILWEIEQYDGKEWVSEVHRIWD